MNEFKTFVGIDISKKTFDAALHQGSQATPVHQCFDQSLQGYQAFIHWLKSNEVIIGKDVLICFEHTGIYISGIVNFLADMKACIWVEMALKMKKCMGLQRGANDKLAAINIALYAYRYQDEAKLWKPIDTALEQLRNLIVQRDRIVLSLMQLTVPLNELEQCGNRRQAVELKKLQCQAVKGLEASLQCVEKAMEDYINKDQTIRHKINLVRSVKGVGQQTAVALFVYTHGFTSFENAKQLACYCGVVPFSKSSGTSVRYKPGVSPFANRKLKKLLHLCAMAALQWDAEIKMYYRRKINEGKNKMSIINAIRNKLIQRIFAVIRDDRMFVNKYAYAEA